MEQFITMKLRLPLIRFAHDHVEKFWWSRKHEAVILLVIQRHMGIYFQNAAYRRYVKNNAVHRLGIRKRLMYTEESE